MITRRCTKSSSKSKTRQTRIEKLYNDGQGKIIESLDIANVVKQLSDLKIFISFAKIQNSLFMR